MRLLQDEQDQSNLMKNEQKEGIKIIALTKNLGGGGGYSPQILVGMCRGKVKIGKGLRNELPVERENVGLRNELEPF